MRDDTFPEMTSCLRKNQIYSNRCKSHRLNAKIIGVGAFKNVYASQYLREEHSATCGEACVVKVFKSGAVFEESYFQHELEIVKISAKIIDAFNNLQSFANKVILNEPQVWKHDGDGERVIVEPMIPNYEKFNSNTGWSAGRQNLRSVSSVHLVMQALSHFSYDITNGELLLCDLQGGLNVDNDIVLSDPVIMSRSEAHGPTDLGNNGIETFFSHHECNLYCSKIWIKPKPAKNPYPVCKGTSMIARELAQLNVHGTSTVKKSATLVSKLGRIDVEEERDN